MEINSYVHNTATQGREIYSQIEGWNFKSKSILQTTTFLLCKQNNSEGLLASTRALKKQWSFNDALKWTWVDVQQLGGTARWQKETLDVFLDIQLREKGYVTGWKGSTFFLMPRWDAASAHAQSGSLALGVAGCRVAPLKQPVKLRITLRCCWRGSGAFLTKAIKIKNLLKHTQKTFSKSESKSLVNVKQLRLFGCLARQNKTNKKKSRHITVINKQSLSIMECTEGKMHRINLKSV